MDRAYQTSLDVIIPARDKAYVLAALIGRLDEVLRPRMRSFDGSAPVGVRWCRATRSAS
jgi:hypothetical protein